MVTEEMYEEEDFIINLTIDGTEFEEVEVKVTDRFGNVYTKVIENK